MQQRMTELPEGWAYRTRILDEDLVSDMTPGVAIPSTADELGQVYVRIVK